MSPLTRRSMLRLGAAAASCGVAASMIAGCSGDDPGDDVEERVNNPDPNINLTGMPIVKETTTIRMMTRHHPNTAGDWNTVGNMTEMEQLSNIHVDWGPVPWEGASEKVNLALASGDYPEILHRANLSAVDIARYGEQGVFIPLNDLIDQHMPNLKGLLAANPDVAKGMTFPDGNIYSLPTIYDPDFDSLIMQQRLWVRTDWLDKFGMETPQTVDEFEAYLTEVRDGDPNGNGKKDEIPYTTGIDGLFIKMFWGTFGVGNKGDAGSYLDADDSGALRFWPTSDNYRELMEFVQRLYRDKLIQQDIFSSDTGKFNTLGQQNILGAVGTQSPTAYFGPKVGQHYVALPPLKRSASDPVPSWNLASSALQSIGQFVITDHTEHPIESARWMDHFYGDDGARLFFMGVEGESYHRTEDGEYEFLPVITDNPDGLTLDEALRPYVTYLGGGYPGIVTEEYFKAFNEQSLEGVKAIAPHKTDEIWPVFTFTADEATELGSLTNDITKLVGESQAKFVTGEMTASDWDTYLDQFDRVGLPRYLEIQQAAYERYRG